MERAAAAGLRVGAFKPIETGVSHEGPEDGMKLHWDKIFRSLELIEPLCDTLFIEGAGGVLVPIDENYFMADLPKLFGAHTVLVSGSRLGSINDTLLSAEALSRRGIRFDLVINLFEERESFETVTLPYYEKAGIEHYLLPRDLDPLAESLSKRP